jgi:hypothetical protein
LNLNQRENSIRKINDLSDKVMNSFVDQRW